MLNFARKLVTPEKSLRIDPTILAEAEVLTRWTPDYWYLQQYLGQFLFVADEMMSERRRHDLLPKSDVMRIGAAYTKSAYIMLNKQLGKASWPAVMPVAKHIKGPIGRAPKGIIKGEIYFVRSAYFSSLDKYKENGTVHVRQRVSLDFPYREQRRREHFVTKLNHGKDFEKVGAETVLGEWKHGTISAWMYVGVPEHFFWDNYAEQKFAPAKLKIPQDKNLRPYYFFE